MRGYWRLYYIETQTNVVTLIDGANVVVRMIMCDYQCSI